MDALHHGCLVLYGWQFVVLIIEKEVTLRKSVPVCYVNTFLSVKDAEECLVMLPERFQLAYGVCTGECKEPLDTLLFHGGYCLVVCLAIGRILYPSRCRSQKSYDWYARLTCCFGYRLVQVFGKGMCGIHHTHNCVLLAECHDVILRHGTRNLYAMAHCHLLSPRLGAVVEWLACIIKSLCCDASFRCSSEY